MFRRVKLFFSQFQVSCLDDVCGMLPFMRRRRPDQLYRAWTSLFVHAGLLHLAATLALQWLFMRDLEKMAGPVRLAIVYLGSGVAGNMASAIFEPYRAEVRFCLPVRKCFDEQT